MPNLFFKLPFVASILLFIVGWLITAFLAIRYIYKYYQLKRQLSAPVLSLLSFHAYIATVMFLHQREWWPIVLQLINSVCPVIDADSLKHISELPNPSLLAPSILLTIAFVVFQIALPTLLKACASSGVVSSGGVHESFVMDIVNGLKLTLSQSPALPHDSRQDECSITGNLSTLRPLYSTHEMVLLGLKASRNQLVIDRETWDSRYHLWQAKERSTQKNWAVCLAGYASMSKNVDATLGQAIAITPRIDRVLVVDLSESTSSPVSYDRTVEWPFSIEIISFEDLLQEIAVFPDYESFIRRRAEATVTDGSQINYDDVFIDPDFELEAQDETQSTVAAPVSSICSYIGDWLRRRTATQLAVLGDWGQGKSTLALILTYRLLRDHNRERLPILISLRGRNPADSQPADILAAWCAEYSVHPAAINCLDNAGRLLLILDGFDEMVLVGDPDKRARHFATLWRLNHPQAKMIFTGRPSLFLDDVEMKRNLGLVRMGDNSPYCEAVTLKLFSKSQAELYLQRYNPDYRGDLVRQVLNIQKNDPLPDYLGRPSILSLIASHLDDSRLRSMFRTANPTIILGRLIALTLIRQQEKASRHDLAPGEPARFMTLTHQERSYFLRGIAAFMFSTGEANVVSAVELRNMVRRLYSVMPKAPQRDAPKPAGFIVVPPIQNRPDEPDILLKIEDDVRACGLLVSAGDSRFSFAHKSFAEFLCADLYNVWITGGDASAAAILRSLNGNPLFAARNRSARQMAYDLCSISIWDNAPIPFSYRQVKFFRFPLRRYVFLVFLMRRGSTSGFLSLFLLSYAVFNLFVGSAVATRAGGARRGARILISYVPNVILFGLFSLSPLRLVIIAASFGFLCYAVRRRTWAGSAAVRIWQTGAGVRLAEMSALDLFAAASVAMWVGKRPTGYRSMLSDEFRP